MNSCSGAASKGVSSSVVLSIGTHRVELLFLLKQGQYIYVRSNVGLLYGRHRILSSYGSHLEALQGPFFGG